MKRHVNGAFPLRKSLLFTPFAWSSADSRKWFPFPPSGGSRRCHRRLVAEVGEERTPLRPDRHFPRAKRKPPYRYPYLKHRKAPHQTSQTALVEIAVS